MYELMGSLIYCYAANMISDAPTLGSHGISFVLFLITLVAWEVSSAHFNLGITIANLFCEIDDFRESWFKYFLAIVAQLVGAVLAMMLSRATTVVTEYGDGRVPTVNPKGVKVEPENFNGFDVKQNVFGAEFLMSLMYYLTWIMIRKSNLQLQSNEMNRVINLMKPVFVAGSHAACRMIF